MARAGTDRCLWCPSGRPLVAAAQAAEDRLSRWSSALALSAVKACGGSRLAMWSW